MNNIDQIKPIYDLDKTFNKCKIIYGDREYILSSELFCRILNLLDLNCKFNYNNYLHTYLN